MNRRTWLFLTGCLLAAVSCATVAVDRFGQCGSYEREMAQVWNDQTRQQVQDAVANVGHPAPEKLTALIDKYAAMWIAAREESCDKTKIKDSRERAAYAACLDANRLHLHAYLELVTQNQFQSARSARRYLSSVLQDLYMCRSPQYYRAYLKDLTIKDLSKLAAAEIAYGRAMPLTIMLGDDQALETAAEEALQTAQVAGSKRLVAWAKVFYAVQRIRNDRYAEARAYLDSAERDFQELDFPYGVATTFLFRGHVAIAERESEQAVQFFKDGLEKYSDAEGESSFLVGTLYAARGYWEFEDDQERALSSMNKAVAIARVLRDADPQFLFSYLSMMGFANLNLGRYGEAADLFEEALVILREDPSDLDGGIEVLEKMIQSLREMMNEQPPDEGRN